ncbi:hypothetical protein HYH03_003920 [Edaphochlamys debaryana]|uniref:Peptidase C1A papain C-terminal domain-containing protein n=1 Tax=Edaphochlamys debaryana TaxID=47281 RepID=A0A836C3T7_9CHLO|nr:hypothetical protein HYH03_003920 [Edaphochlamys debaryana]|eukprot:KAG2498163.1 hypothetical protein HYH03_003920 [Edaphochlamys debaryana]
MAHNLLPALVAVFALAGALAARPFTVIGALRKPDSPPVWPDSYEVEYTVSVPYMHTLQPGGLTFPVHIWWDGPELRYRYDVYGGMDSIGFDKKKGDTWNMYPRLTEMGCDAGNNTGGGPTRGLGLGLGWGRLRSGLGLGLLGEDDDDDTPDPPLPSIANWTFAGTGEVGSSEAYMWQYTEQHGGKTTAYVFYTSPAGHPLRFTMLGVNMITGTHLDEFIYDFSRFVPGPVEGKVFKLPQVCEDKLHPGAKVAGGGVSGGGGGSSNLAAQLALLAPSALLGSSRSSPARRASALASIRTAAESTIAANARFVDEHNARVAAAAAAATTNGGGGGGDGSSASDAPTFTLALNRFAHMTHAQWRAAYLGRKRSKPPPSGRTYYTRVLSDAQLPPEVDWRGTGADGPGVKDQCLCGSCYAFGATGAMQASWFLATGQSLSLSEQHLIDCTWDFGNSGCDGGDVEPALDYVLAAGGAAETPDYPYMGKNAWCRGPMVPGPHTPDPAAFEAAAAAARLDAKKHPNRSPVPVAAKFASYVHVAPRDEQAVMEALYLHGPLAVVLDGSEPDLTFYAEGVYHNKDCGQALEDTDHVVVLVGYGTTPEGVDYWIIRNSWSKYWGMDGYARITRKGNDCGVSTNAVFTTVDPAAAEAARAAAARLRKGEDADDAKGRQAEV